MVHRKNRRSYFEKKLAYDINRDIIHFVLDNAYIDRQLGEVINRVSQDEIVNMLRKKYGNPNFSSSSSNQRES